MDPFDKGASVRQRVTPITGTVADVAYDPEARGFRYLVDYTDDSGQPLQRWFSAAELEAQQ